MDVPLYTPYVSVGRLLRMFTPGAEMFGFVSPAKGDGPRPEKDAMAPASSYAPVAYAST
jgi:hypothetical protein